MFKKEKTALQLIIIFDFLERAHEGGAYHCFHGEGSS